MRVELYAPDKLYGFCEGDGSRVFFHLEAFAAGRWGGLSSSPPPILGERVQVDYDEESNPGNGKAPRALSVERCDPPVRVKGVVESFNMTTGWGFALGDDGVSYYLHRSEVGRGRLPVAGQRVTFYAGFKRGRPRACHVQVGEMAR